MATGVKLQQFLLSLESGGLAAWVRRTLLGTIVLAIILMTVFWKFQNFGNAAGFDQAQIAREIAKGNGFTTQAIRPLAIWFLKENHKPIDYKHFPELSQAPLNPYFNSLLMRFFSKDYLSASPTFILYVDRTIVACSILFFLLSALILYLMLIRLFDSNLAFLTVVLVVAGDIFWQFTQSGLPQMMMLLLFNLSLYTLVRAIEVEFTHEGKAVGWVLATGLFLGLLTLAHGLGAWVFSGVLAFTLIFFRQRYIFGALLFLIFFLVVSPWLFKNYIVSGNPFGMSLYSALDGVPHPLQTWMSHSDPDFSDAGFPSIRKKVAYELLTLSYNLVENYGSNLIALCFFISLLHPFKQSTTAALKWCVLLVFLFTTLGMAIFSKKAVGIDINQLFILFIPVMTAYGLAFLFVLWQRGMPPNPLLKTIFVGVLVSATALPLAISLLTSTYANRYWPPYFVPSIAYMTAWTTQEEALVTDVPEAMAYHADRTALLLPISVKKFIEYVDYQEIKKPIVGLFLTPLTIDKKFLADLTLGPYRQWASFALGPYKAWVPKIASTSKFKDDLANMGFPFDEIAHFPIDSMCVLYLDKHRLESFKSSQGTTPSTEAPDKPEKPKNEPAPQEKKSS